MTLEERYAADELMADEQAITASGTEAVFVSVRSFGRIPQSKVIAWRFEGDRASRTVFLNGVRMMPTLYTGSERQSTDTNWSGEGAPHF